MGETNFVTAKRTRLNPAKVEAMIVVNLNQDQVDQYVHLHGPLDLEEFEAFKKIDVINMLPMIRQDDDSSDLSSDDEYFIPDEDD